MCGLSTVVTPAGASLTMYREIRSYANSIWDDNNNNTHKTHTWPTPCNLPLQTQKSRPPPSNRATHCSRGVVIPPSSPFNTQSVRAPTTSAHVFFLRKKIPASHRARVGTSTVSLALGAYREGKERVKGKARRAQSTRMAGRR